MSDGTVPGRRPGAGEEHAPLPAAQPSGELFVVDNSDEEWKVAQYLREWCDVARALDVATGYFDIGALLALDGQWQKLERIRILMGEQVSLRTRHTFEQALGAISAALDHSIEAEKERNDFLEGVPAIVAALQDGRIACRVYRERKFHAKAYITYARARVMGATALVGSSNFTRAGLNENVELNVRLRSEVETLQAWYEHYWTLAEDVTPAILRVVERFLAGARPRPEKAALGLYRSAGRAPFLNVCGRRFHHRGVPVVPVVHVKQWPLGPQMVRYEPLMRMAQRHISGALGEQRAGSHHRRPPDKVEPIKRPGVSA